VVLVVVVILLDNCDRKCDHYGRTNHTKPYCWKKYDKLDHVHQVIDGAAQP
jgi:hypothetical protein